MESLCSISILIFIMVIIIYSINEGRAKRKSIAAAWGQFAIDTGLNINQPKYTLFSDPAISSITGKYKGFDYVLAEVIESSGDSSTSYTCITMKFPAPVDYNLLIYREGLLSKVEKMFGGQDIQVGNKEFDDSFMIKSKSHYKIDKLLTPELQRKMLFGTHLINITLSEKKVENKIIGIIENAQDLLYLSEILLELAKNAYGKEITSEKDNRKEITDRSYKKAKKPSETPILRKTFQEPAKSVFTSDFTGDLSHHHETKPSSHLDEVKFCPFCTARVPAVNKFCIECGKEL